MPLKNSVQPARAGHCDASLLYEGNNRTSDNEPRRGQRTPIRRRELTLLSQVQSCIDIGLAQVLACG